MSTRQEDSAAAMDGEWPFIHHSDVIVRHTPALWHFENFDRLRDQARVHFGEAEGHEFWMLTRMDDIREVMQNPQIFSNSSTSPPDPDPVFVTIPENIDPPIHTKWRQLLSPLFAPAAVEKLESRVSQRMSEILDELVPRGYCEYVTDVAVRFPNVIFMEIMGLPQSEAEQFQKWEVDILHSSFGTEVSLKAQGEVFEYFTQLLAERRRNPQDDLVSIASGFVIDGTPVTDEDLLSMCLLLFMAGLDTVAMQLSYSMLHLATHDEDRRRLVAEPALFPSAIEEFVRCFAFVPTGRKVLTDTDFHGCPMKAGQVVMLPLVSANRDPLEFENADQVIIDRSQNRHLGFGAGPHRCIGSHLARQELRIGLADWHARIPEYRLAPDTVVREHGGALIGLDNLHLVWDT